MWIIYFNIVSDYEGFTLKIEDQVCSIQVAKCLKELGVKQDSYFHWHKWFSNRDFELVYDYDRLNNPTENYSAFTVAELGEMLPNYFSTYKYKKGWGACWGDNMYDIRTFNPLENSKEADARALIIIYLIEHDLLKIT